MNTANELHMNMCSDSDDDNDNWHLCKLSPSETRVPGRTLTFLL
jgi:hypothetical protein